MEDWAEIRRLHRAEAMPITALGRRCHAQMLAAWSRGLGLPEDCFLVASMRGHVNPFRDRQAFADLARAIHSRAVGALVIDPVSVAYSGADANPAEVRSRPTEMEAWFRATSKDTRPS